MKSSFASADGPASKVCWPAGPAARVRSGATRRILAVCSLLIGLGAVRASPATGGTPEVETAVTGLLRTNCYLLYATLPESTIVLPGHREPTDIGREKTAETGLL